MTTTRSRRRLLAPAGVLVSALVCAMTALAVAAPAASASPAPDPGTGTGTGVVFVPLSTPTQVVHDTQGLAWWAIVIIALVAAVLAAAATEVVDTMRHRRSGLSLSAT